MGYIYKITNEENDKVYIGATSFDIQKRFKEHCHDCNQKKYKDRPLYQAMREIGINKFHIKLIESTDDLDLREQYWISYYDSYNNGYNATLGGKGKKINKNSDQKIIESYQRLHSMTDVANQFNICVDTVKTILLDNDIEILSSPEVMKKTKGIPVQMYSKTDEYICTFDSKKEAAYWLVNNNYASGKSITGIVNHINEVIKGNRKTAYKFKWRLI